MSQKDEELITVLDAGSAKTRVLVAEIHEGALRYRAHGVVDSAGVRKGLISESASCQPRHSTMRQPRLSRWRMRSFQAALSGWVVPIYAE